MWSTFDLSQRRIARAFLVFAFVSSVAACTNQVAKDFAASFDEIDTSDIRPPLDPQVSNALSSPGKVTLFSLEPEMVRRSEQNFHGYRVLGVIDANPSFAAATASSLRDAILSERTRSAAMCFNPRHGLRVHSEGHVYDFVVCYECNNLRIYRDSDPMGSMTLWGSPDAMNEQLKAANIPLSAR